MDKFAAELEELTTPLAEGIAYAETCLYRQEALNMNAKGDRGYVFVDTKMEESLMERLLNNYRPHKT